MDEIEDLSALTNLAVNSSTADVLAALKLLDGINRCVHSRHLVWFEHVYRSALWQLACPMALVAPIAARNQS